MTHDLLSAFVGTLDRHCRYDDRRLQTLEFAGAPGQLASVGLALQQVAFFKDLIVISIGIGAISMALDDLGRGGINQSIRGRYTSVLWIG